MYRRLSSLRTVICVVLHSPNAEWTVYGTLVGVVATSRKTSISREANASSEWCWAISYCDFGRNSFLSAMDASNGLYQLFAFKSLIMFTNIGVRAAYHDWGTSL
jgi:hypothetical protein